VNPAPALDRWLADMFWDYRESRISRSSFVERYMIRVSADASLAEKAYDAILESIDTENNTLGYFEMENLVKSIKSRQYLSPLLLSASDESLIISTIHKAKGREFDNVYMVCDFSPKDKSTEEARIWYVGVTRPKRFLRKYRKGKWSLVKSKTSQRWMKQGFRKGKWKTVGFCKGITIGLSGDLNDSSYVAGTLVEAVQRQAYISQSVNIMDKVEIILNDAGVYGVYHRGFLIGTLSEKTQIELARTIREKYSWSGTPIHLQDVYISNISTIVPHYFPTGVDIMFKESRFWLGVEISGFAGITKWLRGGS
jgi:hypothetical protein